MTSSNLSESGLIAYFGYGSLVCRKTHRTEIVAAHPARLHGWRREWRPRPDMPGFPAALLSVRREAGTICDGLLVLDQAENLAAIDRREARYERVELPREAVECDAELPASCPIYLYVAETHIPPHPEPPRILQSYLDAVLQGFHAEHGEDGVHRFLSETDGFAIAIHADRHAPIYPRAVALTPQEVRLFDRLTASLSARGTGRHRPCARVE